MRYQIIVVTGMSEPSRHVNVDEGSGAFITFAAVVGNSNYDSFLVSQSLTDAEVQAMTPDVWHDMA